MRLEIVGSVCGGFLLFLQDVSIIAAIAEMADDENANEAARVQAAPQTPLLPRG